MPEAAEGKDAGDKATQTTSACPTTIPECGPFISYATADKVTGFGFLHEIFPVNSFPQVQIDVLPQVNFETI